MRKLWNDRAWDEYIYWQNHNKKMVEKIHQLLRDTERAPFSGLGKPEPLKGQLSGCWSRRITDEHRLIYRVRDDTLELLSCMGHYNG